MAFYLITNTHCSIRAHAKELAEPKCASCRSRQKKKIRGKSSLSLKWVPVIPLMCFGMKLSPRIAMEYLGNSYTKYFRDIILKKTKYG